MSAEGSERSRAQRTEDILSAAERVFARDGFAATTMDAIAREAGVSKGGLYRHVASKDELFLTILARSAGELESHLRQACEDGSQKGYATLEACVARAVAFARQSEGRFRLALDSSAIRDLVEPQNPALPAFDAAIAKLVQLGLDVLERGQQDGSIRADVHVHALAVSLWGSIVGTLQIERNVRTIAARIAAPGSTTNTDLVTVITSSARPARADEATHLKEKPFGKRSGED
jgi:AcrR family transcriptional regulator